jgi:hypothetical protein
MKTAWARLFALITTAFLALMLPISAGAMKAEVLPHYFPPGLLTTTKASDQWAILFDTLKTTNLCQRAGSESQMVINTRTIREIREVYGKKVTFYFDLWTKERDGKIYYADFCGRKLVTEEEFAVAKEDIIAYYIAGVREAYEYHKNIETDIVKAIAQSEKTSEQDVRAELDRIVPELAHLSPPVTFREALRIPQAPFSPADFVQTNVHYVHAPYWGMVIVDSEIVFLTPQGRIIDHLIGRPSVVAHELTHGNQKLQTLLDGIDHEYLASIPMLLVPEDKFFFMFHGYVKEMREIAEVLFGFNFKQARDEIFTFRMEGINVRVNEEKLNEYAAKLDSIKEALSVHYRVTVLPELYRHRLFWSSLNSKLQDDHGVFRILAMMDFDPTSLDGHAKTMEWLATREDEIKQMADTAFKNSGVGADTKNAKGGRRDNATSLRRLMVVTGLTEERALELAKRHDIDLAKLSRASDEEVLNTILRVLRAERNMIKPTNKEGMR